MNRRLDAIVPPEALSRCLIRKRGKKALELLAVPVDVTVKTERACRGDVLGEVIDEKRGLRREAGAHRDELKRRGMRFHVADLMAEIGLVAAERAIGELRHMLPMLAIGVGKQQHAMVARQRR